jgi:glucan biosynthesis protein
LLFCIEDRSWLVHVLLQPVTTFVKISAVNHFQTNWKVHCAFQLQSSNWNSVQRTVKSPFFYMCCSLHFHNNNSIYPTNAHSLFCKILHRFANMFWSRGIIIRAPHTLNIVMLLYILYI